ncbi:MAG: hypothetical protein KDA69_08720 [Planctomycetaceae bacterium]|nr:hypothetical protein [Planctomycetaceae bacterium]MCA9044389.1 hypothetical protein [Planctomycetaceae bacterium]MCB9951632.1 hypothetical protein [Planctomycetaceae bacterium]
MSRIFLTLAIFSNVLLACTAFLGWSIEDAASLSDAARNQVGTHMLIALAAAIIALLVHAVVLTYFMGTGRWIEETSAAYSLAENARRENIQLKYRVIPGLVTCLLLIIVTGAFGAISDPASNASMKNSAAIHSLLAITTLLANVFVSFQEWGHINRNTQIVDDIIAEVRRIRTEKGLEN